MTKTAEQAERDVEQRRARLDRTLDGLQARLNAAGLREDLLGTDPNGLGWRDRPVRETAEDLLATARRNPGPVLMIAAGLSWLVYETARRSLHRPPQASMRPLPASAAGQPYRPPHGDLDEGLEETFPGSDPVAVRITR